MGNISPNFHPGFGNVDFHVLSINSTLERHGSPHLAEEHRATKKVKNREEDMAGTQLNAIRDLGSDVRSYVPMGDGEDGFDHSVHMDDVEVASMA
ncbi:hypothetical protein V6N13_059109 [Hibiscus sabdariffa]